MHVSNRYADIRAKAARVRERALFVSPRIPNELELQARWFAGDFGKHFVSTTGDKIDIVQFGTWNREAGPDFRDAAIRINGSDPIRGCIELDVSDRGWEAHGHATNPAFEAPDLGVFKGLTRKYVRTLWDRWWPHRDAMQRIILPAKVWRISSTRPVNHPQRRLAALAMLAREWVAFRRMLGKAIAGGTPATTAREFFRDLDHPFWNSHYTLASDASPKKLALIGESRVTDILANVLFSFWLAEDVEVWPAYALLPARLSNRRLETAATRLFGNDPRRAKFLKTVASQQGLLQIYEDFCMQDNSDCAQCPFPEQMRKWT